MPLFAAVAETDATDKVEQTYGRIKEMLESTNVPAPFLAYGKVPAFLQDFYMNFKRFVFSDGKLDAKTKAMIAFVVAANQKSSQWVDWLNERCRKLGWSEQELADGIAVASTCLMYNVFFKFRDNAGSDLFSGMAVGLRAHTFANSSLDSKVVELINIVISDINGCKPCTSGHVSESQSQGLSDEAILEAVQCGATMASGANFLAVTGHS